MTQSNGVGTRSPETESPLADHPGLAIHPLDDGALDLEPNGIEDPIFMPAKHPGKLLIHCLQ